MNTNHIMDLAQTYQKQWPKPDMALISGGREKAPEIPLAVFGDVWSSWMKVAANGRSAPVDYIVGGVMAVVSALVGNVATVSPWPDWNQSTTLWVACVGNPSAGKTPALDFVLSLLRTLESEQAKDLKQQRQDYAQKLETARAIKDKWRLEVKTATQENKPAPPMPDEAVEPEPPTEPRLLVVDATVESLAKIHSRNLRGLLLFRDELSGLIEGFGRYGSQGADRAFYNEAYNGNRYVMDRVKNDENPIRIPRLSLSIAGGIQPDKLKSAILGGDDDGLSARFLYFWPDPVTPTRPRGKTDKTIALEALRRILNIPMPLNEFGEPTPKGYPLASEAVDCFHDYRLELAREEEGASGLYLSFLGKLPGVVLKLALIIEFMRWAVEPFSSPEPPGQISKESVYGALGLADAYFKPMAKRAFGEAALPRHERDAAALARFIFKARPETVNARKLQQKRLGGINKAERMYAALNELEEAGWIDPVPSREGETAGRKKADYDVNPRIWETSDE